MESKANLQPFEMQPNCSRPLLIDDLSILTDQLFPKAEILQLDQRSNQSSNVTDKPYDDLLTKRKYEAERVAVRRSQETAEQRETRLAKGREYMRRKRAMLAGEIEMAQVKTEEKAPRIEQILQQPASSAHLNQPMPSISLLSTQQIEQDHKPIPIQTAAQPGPSLVLHFDIKTEASTSDFVSARSNRWLKETPERRLERLEKQRDYMRQKRQLKYAHETPEERAHRLEVNRQRTRIRRLNETSDERERRLIQQRNYSHWARSKQTPLEKEEIRAKDQLRSQRRRAGEKKKETEEEKAIRLERERGYRIERRARESSEQRELRIQRQREARLEYLSNETTEKREQRLAYLREYQRQRHATETPEERERRLTTLRNYCRLKSLRNNDSERKRGTNNGEDEDDCESITSNSNSIESSARSLDLDALLQLSEELSSTNAPNNVGFPEYSGTTNQMNSYIQVMNSEAIDDELSDTDSIEDEEAGSSTAIVNIVGTEPLELPSIVTTFNQTQ